MRLHYVVFGELGNFADYKGFYLFVMLRDVDVAAGELGQSNFARLLIC
jgi:hypothetical protein